MSLDTIVNGLLLGGFYSAIALGLSLVFGVMRLVNLAHGELLVGGAFLAYYVTDYLGLDPLVSLVLVCPLLFVIAYPVQRLLLTDLLVRGLEPPLVATFGLSIVAQAVFVAAFSGNPKSLDASYGVSGFSVEGVDVRTIYLIAFGFGVGLAVATALWLRRTRLGTAVRAASADPETAATMGVNVKHVYAFTFGLAAAMAAIGGVLVGLAFAFTPTTGIQYLIKGFTVVVLGGIGSVGGTLAAGLFLGLAENVGAEVFGGAYRDLAVYILFIVVLVARPRGFFGRAAG